MIITENGISNECQCNSQLIQDVSIVRYNILELVGGNSWWGTFWGTFFCTLILILFQDCVTRILMNSEHADQQIIGTLINVLNQC